MSTETVCACKGVRHCLLCEDSQRQDEQSPIQDYLYCGTCAGIWLTDTTFDNHALSHSGEFISFPGIDMIPEFVTELEEQQLRGCIDSGKWMASQSGRNKQDFGPKVNFKKKKLHLGSFVGLPLYSRTLINRFAQHFCLMGFHPVELCNLEYIPERGSAIDAHFDDAWLWGERLVTLNLLSDTVMTFTDDTQPNVAVLVQLPRRSLVVVSGPARHRWKHAIRRQHITTRRIAMTFRELSEEFTDKGDRGNVGRELMNIASSYVSVS